MALLTIVGMGNRLCGDDAVGPSIIDELVTWDHPDLELFEGGSDALSMLDKVAGRGHVIIVDATRMGLPPGSVRLFTPGDVKMMVMQDHLSLHGIGLTEALKLGAGLGLLPADLKFIGIQPQAVNVNTSLSKPVIAAMSEVLNIIRAEMQEVRTEKTVGPAVGRVHEGKIYV